jgi:hypothetical protein
MKDIVKTVKNNPLFFDSTEKDGRYARKKNRPIFVGGKKFWISKAPSDVNDISRSKATYEEREPNIPSKFLMESTIKNSKTINSKTGNKDDNLWMWEIFMKRNR